MKASLTTNQLELKLSGFCARLDGIARAANEIRICRPEKIILAGVGAWYAAALAARPAFFEVPGISGERIEVCTPSVAAFSGERGAETLAVIFGENDYDLKNVIRICADGDIRVDCIDMIEQYLIGASAGMILAASVTGKIQETVEMLKKSAEKSTRALQKWETSAEKAAAIIKGCVDAYETVGTGGGDYAAAWMTRTLLYSTLGTAVTVEESEDWLHVNFLQLNPERFGTMVFVSSDNEAADRTLRTLKYIEGIGRKTVVFTDILEPEVGEYVINLPKLPKLVFPLFSILPAALVIGKLI